MSVNGEQKHMLPVPESCTLWRRNDIFGVNHTVCERRDGVPLKNQASTSNGRVNEYILCRFYLPKQCGVGMLRLDEALTKCVISPGNTRKS